MSLTHAMTTLTHDLAAAHAARRDALAGIGMSTTKHLKDARQARRAMAAAHSFRITEFKDNLHVNTAMLLGAADDRIEEYGRQRDQLASIRRQRRRDGADAMRRAMGERLRAAADTRQAAAVSWRSERAARRSTLQQRAGQQKARTRTMMHDLNHDRATAGEIWSTATRRAAAGTDQS